MATYYVGTGGNNASAGTSWGTRWLTLTKAASVVTAGDTVYCQGTFRETLTLTTSGTAGNVITWIGDYAGTNTSGSKGIARITGSDDDITSARGTGITASAVTYNTIQGFTVDMASGKGVYLTNPVGCIIKKCYVSSWVSGSSCVMFDGTSQSASTISECVLLSTAGARAITLSATSTVNAAHAIQNIVIIGGAASEGVNVARVGDVTVKNVAISGCGVYGIVSSNSPAAGHPIVVNNCMIMNVGYGFYAVGAGDITENYNTLAFISNAPRVNVTAGANSVTTQPLFDTRWFFEAVNGGTLITPFDLASYSTLVEYDSGTGAPSTDLRGASQTGSYREWGPLEYNAGLSITGGTAATAAYPPIGGSFIKGR